MAEEDQASKAARYPETANMLRSIAADAVQLDPRRRKQLLALADGFD